MVKVGDDADLVFKVTRGSKVILYKSLAPQCFQCESGLVVDRGKHYLVVASASRVPQAWTVSKNGTVKVVATKFGFKDYYRQVKGNRIVFAKVFSPYSKSYSVLNVKTLEFTNLTASEARSRNLAI